MAVGSARLCEENLKITLADSARFRSLTGSANRTAALTRIYLDSLPPPASQVQYTLAELTALRPYALISSTQHGRRVIAVGASVERGELAITISMTIQAGEVNDPQAARTRLLDHLGQIADELRALSDQAGVTDSYLVISDYRLEGPFLYDEEELEDKGYYAWGVIIVTHGSE